MMMNFREKGHTNLKPESCHHLLFVCLAPLDAVVNGIGEFPQHCKQPKVTIAGERLMEHQLYRRIYPLSVGEDMES